MTEKPPQDQPTLPSITYVEANLFAMFSFLGQWRRIEVHDEPDLLWCISDIPFPLFNSVLRARLPVGRADEAIDEATGRCKSRHVPMLWWTGPTSRPADLEARLVAKGFHGENAHGMAVDLRALSKKPPVPPGLEVKQVSDFTAMAQWCRVVCAGFDMPDLVGEALLDLSRSVGLGSNLPLRNYLGSQEEGPVAVSSLFLGAGVAGIYNVATLPGARRRGVGAAMTFRALEDAAAEGYRVAILHASEMAVRVYLGLGFEEQCKIGQFVWVG